MATPVPDLDAAGRALGEHLHQWLSDPQPPSLVQVIVGPPGTEVGAAVERVALRREGQVAAPPSPAALLTGDWRHANALQHDESRTAPLTAIPRLERWYLRHEQGLASVRALVERLVRQRRRTLIGCDSWAWAFLQRAMGVEETLGKPLTVAPWDAGRLSELFHSSGLLQRLTFKQEANGGDVFPPPPADGDRNRSTPPETSQLLRNLAARARGNPGVALALWRNALRSRPEDDDRYVVATTDRPTLWLATPSDLVLPQLPGGLQRLHQFLLHALLLHSGLPECCLLELLPYPADQVLRRLSELRAARIVVGDEEQWRVSESAYPAVRAQLQDEGFLADAF